MGKGARATLGKAVGTYAADAFIDSVQCRLIPDPTRFTFTLEERFVFSHPYLT